MIRKLKTLKNHAGFIRYFKNTSWMMLEQLMRIISGLLVGIWVARYLGPEQFGLFSYVLAFTAIFGGIAKLGLDSIIVRELINHPDRYEIYLGTAFWLKILGALLVIGIVAAIACFANNDATTNLFIFIISGALIFQSFEVIEFYFQSQVLAKIISICKMTQLVLSSLIKIYLVLVEAELFYFILVTAFDTVSLAVSYAFAFTRLENKIFYKHFNLTIALKLLKDSWPLMLSAIVVMIYMRIDQIMIKEICGQYEVGIYSAAVRISEAIYFIPVLITSSLFPAILNSKKKCQDLYNNRIQKLYTLMIWIAIVIAILITIISDWLVPFLYGIYYKPASAILVIHIWSGIFVFLTVSSGKYLTSEGRTIKIFYRNFSGMLLNVLLNSYFIPKHGIQGAAYATFASWFFAGYLYDFIDKSNWLMARQKTKGFFGAYK